MIILPLNYTAIFYCFASKCCKLRLLSHFRPHGVFLQYFSSFPIRWQIFLPSLCVTCDDFAKDAVTGREKVSLTMFEGCLSLVIILGHCHYQSQTKFIFLITFTTGLLIHFLKKQNKKPTSMILKNKSQKVSTFGSLCFFFFLYSFLCFVSVYQNDKPNKKQYYLHVYNI